MSICWLCLTAYNPIYPHHSLPNQPTYVTTIPLCPPYTSLVHIAGLPHDELYLSQYPSNVGNGIHLLLLSLPFLGKRAVRAKMKPFWQLVVLCCGSVSDISTIGGPLQLRHCAFNAAPCWRCRPPGSCRLSCPAHPPTPPHVLLLPLLLATECSRVSSRHLGARLGRSLVTRNRCILAMHNMPLASTKPMK